MSGNPYIIDARTTAPSSNGYDVNWAREDNPRIVPAEPGDRFAMTYEEAEQSIRDQTDED